MIKKIPVEQLRAGMYIHRFCCRWLHHPYLFNRKRVESRSVAKRLLDWGVREVYIDTSRGFDVDQPAVPGVEERRPMVEAVAAGPSEDVPLRNVPIEQEVVRAGRIAQEARSLVHRMLDDVRSGRQIRSEAAYELVTRMDTSVCRNKDALLLMMRLRSSDEYTFMHSVSVGVLMLAFSRSLGMDAETCRIIGLGGLLHDVGKMAVPRAILNKPAALTDEEYEKIKRHAVYCHEILSQNHNIPPSAGIIAGQHHERQDGSGYPLGLKGEQISRGGQMAAIVDVFDALTADRCYRKGITPVEGLRKLYGWGKSHFKEDLVHRFIRCVGVYPPGTLVRLASGRIAVVIESTESLLRPRVRVVYDARQDWAVSPYDIDLSLEDEEWGDRIEGYASAERYRIEPLRVLGLARR